MKKKKSSKKKGVFNYFNYLNINHKLKLYNKSTPYVTVVNIKKNDSNKIFRFTLDLVDCRKINKGITEK